MIVRQYAEASPPAQGVGEAAGLPGMLRTRESDRRRIVSPRNQ
jgi:hypothetical protein